MDRAWAECAVVVGGRADSGAQEHVYLETQSALALPVENGGLRVLSATQSPTAVQRAIARVLGWPMHRIEVDVRRLGGGFGGKEDQATAWAVLAALGARQLNRPPNTAYRGFGAPQAMFVLEAAIDQAARALGVSPAVIQRKNLLAAGDLLPYGMPLGTPTLRRCWEEVGERHRLDAMRQRVAAFNASHRLEKMGLALMPVCFGISFTTGSGAQPDCRVALSPAPPPARHHNACLSAAQDSAVHSSGLLPSG